MPVTLVSIRPSYRPTVPEQPVRVLEEPHFDPQRRVEVEHNGRSVVAGAADRSAPS
jgi:hypothetical protein